MRGHVARKGTRYYVVVDIGPDPETSRRRQKWHSGDWSTRREAEAGAVEILGRLRSGTYVEGSRQTVRGFLVDEWLPAVRSTMRPSTIRLYETIIGAYIVPRIGRQKLQKLTAAHLNELYGHLLASGARRDDRGLSPTTVGNVHRVIHRALRDAVRWDRLARNPAGVADPPRATRPEMTTWSAGELRVFLEHVASDDWSALWVLMATTGMRRGEALGLRWPDVDLDTGKVTITHALAYVGSRPVLGEPKTARSRRLVVIPAMTVAAMRAHRVRQTAERLATGASYTNKGFVFADGLGAPMVPATISRRFGRLVSEAGLPRVTLHGLRHTFATLALGDGVPTKVVSEVLGHSSLATTADIYSHVTPGMQEEATERVAAAVLGAGPLEER